LINAHESKKRQPDYVIHLLTSRAFYKFSDSFGRDKSDHPSRFSVISTGYKTEMDVCLLSRDSGSQMPLLELFLSRLYIDSMMDMQHSICIAQYVCNTIYMRCNIYATQHFAEFHSALSSPLPHPSAAINPTHQSYVLLLIICMSPCRFVPDHSLVLDRDDKLNLMGRYEPGFQHFRESLPDPFSSI
jgi:hypothetical protein